MGRTYISKTYKTKFKIMSKRVVRNQFTYEKKRKKIPKPDPEELKSMTVPGQETKLRKILEQHSRGMPLPPDKEGQYFGDVDVPDFEGMDLVDIMEYTKSLKNEINGIKAQIQEQKTAAEAAGKQDEITMLREKLAELEKTTGVKLEEPEKEQ